jgi:hypothetical protein
MKKILLIGILILQFGIVSSQETQAEMIIGTWRFEMECDFRPEKEKYTEPKINYFETENGSHYADRIFKSNNSFEWYYTKNRSNFGIYKLIKGKLNLERRLGKEQAENNPNAIEKSLKLNRIEKKKDGYYYFKPHELTIKSLTKNQMEIGTEKLYTIWRRIE